MALNITLPKPLLGQLVRHNFDLGLYRCVREFDDEYIGVVEESELREPKLMFEIRHIYHRNSLRFD